MRINRDRLDKYFFIAFLAILFLVLYERLSIGFPSADEQLYITLPYRFIRGDLFFVDEWHGTQLTGFLNFGLTQLYLLINNGSMDGCVYFFRISYLILMTITVLVLYFLSNRNLFISMALYIYFLSCPFNIMSLSYNTISVISVLITLFLLYRFKNKFSYFFAGLFYSLSVLSIPYLAFVYLGLLSVTIYNLLKKNKKNNYQFIIYFTLGILIMFLLFLFYMLKGDLKDILYGIKFVFDDPTHKSEFIRSLVDYVYQFLRFTNIFFIAWLYFLYKIIKKKEIKYLYYSIVNCIVYISVCFILYTFTSYRYLFMNFLFMTSLLGFSAYYSSQNKNRRLFHIYLISFLFSILLNIQSNVGTQPITTGLIVTNVFSIMLFETKFMDRKIMISMLICCIISIGYLLFFKSYIYDYPVGYNSSYKIQDGLYRGIKCDEKEYNKIQDWHKEAIHINETVSNENDRIMILDYQPLYYVDIKAKIGTFSTYIYVDDINIRDSLYREYLNFHRSKLKYIYIPKNSNLTIPVISDLVDAECKREWKSSSGTLYSCLIDE